MFTLLSLETVKRMSWNGFQLLRLYDLKMTTQMKKRKS